MSPTHIHLKHSVTPDSASQDLRLHQGWDIYCISVAVGACPCSLLIFRFLRILWILLMSCLSRARPCSSWSAFSGFTASCCLEINRACPCSLLIFLGSRTCSWGLERGLGVCSQSWFSFRKQAGYRCWCLDRQLPLPKSADVWQSIYIVVASSRCLRSGIQETAAKSCVWVL